MPGKRVLFDETWQAIEAALSRGGLTFQELTHKAFVLKKHKQPVGLMASLKESVSAQGKSQRGKSRTD